MPEHRVERWLRPPKNSLSTGGLPDTPTTVNPSRVSGAQATPERLQFPEQCEQPLDPFAQNSRTVVNLTSITHHCLEQ